MVALAAGTPRACETSKAEILVFDTVSQIQSVWQLADRRLKMCVVAVVPSGLSQCPSQNRRAVFS